MPSTPLTHTRNLDSMPDPPTLVSMSGVSSLPDELLVFIMRFVPLRPRLGLSSVCTKFDKAATAATDAIECLVGNLHKPGLDLEQQPFSTTSISSWLAAHGGHLTSLKLDQGWGWQLHQLPCQNLVELELDGFQMQFEPDANSPGVLQCSTALTKLILEECCPMETDSDPLGQIAELTCLQHLVLQDIYHRYQQGPDGLQHVLPGSVLQQLQHLTHLTVEFEYSITEESLQHISCLTKLQEVKLLTRTAAAALRAFPEGHYLPLQRMEVCGQYEFNWHVSTAPGINSLTSLTHLKVQECGLHPAALFELTQLQHLHLQKVHEIYDQHRPERSSRMLELLAKLQHLKALLLHKVKTTWPTLPTPETKPYSILTANTDLQCLAVSKCKNFPVAALQQMFGEGKRLPQLHSLTLQWPDAQRRGHLGLEQPRAPVSAPFSTDLVLIIGACPALRELRVSVKPGTDLALLQQCGLTLLHCSTLHEPSTGVQDVSTLRSMLALTRLKELQLPGSPAGTFGDVLQLTALTSLTKLFAKVREFTAGVMDTIKLDLTRQADGISISQQLRTRHDEYKIRQEELNQAWQDHLQLHQQELLRLGEDPAGHFQHADGPAEQAPPPGPEGQQLVQQALMLTPAQQQQQQLLQQFWQQHWWQQQQEHFGAGMHLAQLFDAQADGLPALPPPEWQAVPLFHPHMPPAPPGGLVMLPQGVPGLVQQVQLPAGQLVWQQLPPEGAGGIAQGPAAPGQDMQPPQP